MTGRITNVRPKPGFIMDAAGQIIKAPSNVVPMFDTLSNVLSGMGTSVDKRVYAGYHMVMSDPVQVESSYRSSWLMRKIIDLPARDMTRAWRSWQAERTQITALERYERKIGLRHKVRRALAMARLWGGSALVMGIRGQEPEKPLDPSTVRKDGLMWIQMFSRSQLKVGDEITDPSSPWYRQPEEYIITLRNGDEISIHPSRVIPFIGQPVPEGSSMLAADWHWGDPLYQSIESALKNADLSQDGFASLIEEAKVDVLKMPNLMKNVSSAEYEQLLQKRLQLANSGKSNWRALLLDVLEEWEQKQIDFANVPDVIMTFLQIVSGAADIPVTRLLGQSPKGLQSTGEGEEKDYHASIEARQNEDMQPQLDRIDEVMIRSALGSRPEEIWYKFNSLARLTPKEASEVEKNRAGTVKTYADAAVLPESALSTMAENAIVESGQWPGSEEAFEEAKAQGEEPPEDDPEAVAEVTPPDPEA